jgi:hypothetical protein
VAFAVNFKDQLKPGTVKIKNVFPNGFLPHELVTVHFTAF